MCGIFGMASLRAEPLAYPNCLEAMGASLRQRGPDGHGRAQREHFAVGHERLRIVDLHERADQPFHRPGSRHWLVCNGEIYNAAQIRKRYSDYPYCSESDVEPILPLFRDLGEAGIGELDGMFALVIWDEENRTLTMARDRAGERPLFYRRVGGEVWFASEVQALLEGLSISSEIDEVALHHYLTMGYVPEPRTMFPEIRKVGAGTVMTFTAEGETSRRYWQPETFATKQISQESAQEQLRDLLEAAVRKQMIADVPVGVFLSGGLDSSLLASLAAAESDGQPIHTFSAKFAQNSYDEADWAARHARNLGTNHHEVIIDEGSMSEALRSTSTLAEPLADPAILPTYLLAREARQHVKVVLSGEGADELFGGYPTYLGHAVLPAFHALPSFLQSLIRSAVERWPASHQKVTLEFMLKRFLAGSDEPSFVDRHLRWMGPALQGLSAVDSPAPEPGGGFPFSSRWNGIGSAMLLDYQTYLRDNLLAKVDRAVMLNAVEARAPFLDRDVTAFALRLPDSLRVKRFNTKPLLKSAALKWLPRDVVYRKKRGLSVPISHWLENGLQGEVGRLLAPERLHRQGILDAARVKRMRVEHRTGQADHGRALWALVVLQYWLERWLPGRAGE